MCLVFENITGNVWTAAVSCGWQYTNVIQFIASLINWIQLFFSNVWLINWIARITRAFICILLDRWTSQVAMAKWEWPTFDWLSLDKWAVFAQHNWPPSKIEQIYTYYIQCSNSCPFLFLIVVCPTEKKFKTEENYGCTINSGRASCTNVHAEHNTLSGGEYCMLTMYLNRFLCHLKYLHFSNKLPTNQQNLCIFIFYLNGN